MSLGKWKSPLTTEEALDIVPLRPLQKRTFHHPGRTGPYFSLPRESLFLTSIFTTEILHWHSWTAVRECGLCWKGASFLPKSGRYAQPRPPLPRHSWLSLAPSCPFSPSARNSKFHRHLVGFYLIVPLRIDTQHIADG